MKTIATPLARWALAGSLAVWLAVGWSPNPRPEPVPATANPQEFSAERAIVYVAAIARIPHPIGSREHDRVRDYLRAEFTRLGLDTQLESGTGQYNRRGYHSSASVENIIARLPGTANTKPVMLVAHYDSVPTGPGAGDDAHAVGVLLETLRALRSGPPLRNDVIFLLTDGEERGLLGADLFMREHPWRQEPGIVLNFEARGTGGAAVMFETSLGNDWMIRALHDAVPGAQATSVAYEIYRRMPNDTDLTVFKGGGLAGMNFAFIEHPEFYHRRQDDVEHLDRRSVQEQGRYALSLTRVFGNEDLTAAHAGNAAYFPTRLTPLIVYPEGWVLPIAWIALAALAAAAWLGRGVRGRWIAIPLGILVGLTFLVAVPAPGGAYLLEWPLLAGILSFGLVVSAPEKLGLGGRLLGMLLAPMAVFPLLVPFARNLLVALGARPAAPILAATILVMITCLLPQLVLIARHVSPGKE